MNTEKLRIEKIAMGGMGLGFSQNKAIFVPNTTIGDLIDFTITLEKKDHAFARAVKFYERGEGVIPIVCEAFEQEEPCGACDWLMLDYPTQLKHKHDLIQDLFKEYISEVESVIPSTNQYHYRNKVYMPVGQDYRYGMFARYSHQIVEHKTCMNHPPIFDEIARTLMDLCRKAKVEIYDEMTHKGCLRHIGLRCNRDQSEILLIMVCRNGRLPFSKTITQGLIEAFPQIVGIVQNINRDRGNVILGPEQKLLWGRDYLNDNLSDLSFRINYRSFWQVNSDTLEEILALMRAELKGARRVIDAYCGIGAIGLSLASSLDELIGIEELEEAVEDARQNAADNGFKNTRFVAGKFEQVISEISQSFAADAIILDPPRSGVPESSLGAIRKAEIGKILYLSCSPMSLARDMKILLEGGKYRLKSLHGFDMFPNTWHIETLAVLEIQK
nr:rRNA (uracil1939-C5)-methyltransferase [Candidatus Cloacimonadota bacterium]